MASRNIALNASSIGSAATVAIGGLVSFGFLPAVEKGPVVSSVNTVIALVFAFIAVLHQMIGIFVHSKVTPVADPRNNAGQMLVPAPTVTTPTLISAPVSGDGPLPDPLGLSAAVPIAEPVVAAPAHAAP